MALPIIGPIVGLVQFVFGGIIDSVKQKREIKAKANERRAKLAESQQTHDHEWELRALEGAGWKDDVLFFGIIGMYVWSAFDPESAGSVFEVWENQLPEWFRVYTSWMVASVLGVKKLGDYVPGLIHGIRSAIKTPINGGEG